MKLNITKKEASQIMSEQIKKEQNEKEQNIKKNLEHIEASIRKAAQKGFNETEVSLPANPEIDNGNQQFLITNKQNKESFMKNGYYDESVLNIIRESNFIVTEKSNRDSISGVCHHKLLIKWG